MNTQQWGSDSSNAEAGSDGIWCNEKIMKEALSINGRLVLTEKTTMGVNQWIKNSMQKSAEGQ